MSFTVSMQNFEGPIDLLLNLIEDRKLSISDISLAAVTDQFLEYIAQKQYNLAHVTAFVWVASTLVLIKVKSLLPNVELTTEESGDVLLLELRLKQLALVRSSSKTIEAAWGKRPIFNRPSTLGKVSAFTPGNSVTLQNMQQALHTMIALSKLEQPTSDDLVEVEVPNVVRLEEIMQRVHEIVQRGLTGSFKQITGGITEKRSLIITFLALLEMARQAKVSLMQTDTFADIEFGAHVQNDEIQYSN